jgi:predicted helicase
LFGAAFAQTLAFGLLLVREATGADVDQTAHTHLSAAHPLMQATLRALLEPEIVEEMGAGYDVMRDAINVIDPAKLARIPGGHDPILYFYEDFLAVFDAAARRRYGVFYTPVDVVRFQVGATDRALRDGLRTDGLLDPAVTVLDPACGTGTYLIASAAKAADRAAAE